MLVVSNTTKPSIEVYSSYINILSARVNAYYKMRPMHLDIMMRGIKQLKPLLPDELISHILEFCIPDTFDDSLENLIFLTPPDKILALLSQRNINLEIEHGAIVKMRDMAANSDDEIDLKIGRDHFDLEYGCQPFGQLCCLAKRFKKLPSEILGDPKIEKAFVSKNFIEARRQMEGFKSKKIIVFDLGLRFLHRIPSNFQRLICLKELRLSHNELFMLSGEIGKLTNLEILDLSKNKLVTLCPEIGQLKKLVTLNVSHNRLKTLPRQIALLPQLENFQLTGNEFVLTTIYQFWKYFSNEEMFSICLSRVRSYFTCL